MYAMILAAGRGERMRPLTDKLPKPLLKVNNKSLIVYHLEKLAALGVKHVVINQAWLGHKLKQHLGCGQQWGIEITYLDEGERALETAGGIKNALPHLKSECFIVINGDVWSDFDLNLLPKSLADNELAHLVLVNNPRHNLNGDFHYVNGILHSEGEEKRTFSGIGVYRHELFREVPKDVAPLGPLLRHAMGQQQITGQLHLGLWTDVGTPERLKQLDQQLALNN